MTEQLFPTPAWLIEAYPGWAEVWQDCMWTIDELKTFEKYPLDDEDA